jgi:hypothetical protein
LLDIARERATLVDVVKALGEYLTSGDDEILGKGYTKCFYME